MQLLNILILFSIVFGTTFAQFETFICALAFDGFVKSESELFDNPSHHIVILTKVFNEKQYFSLLSHDEYLLTKDDMCNQFKSIHAKFGKVIFSDEFTMEDFSFLMNEKSKVELTFYSKEKFTPFLNNAMIDEAINLMFDTEQSDGW